MPDLLAIFRVGVDIRSIDVDAASQDGILVTRATPGFVNSVAELAIGMMIDLGRHVSYAVGSYRAGQAPTPRLGRQLYGATLGIIGYGAVGQRLAGLAQTLAMTVLVNDPFASNFAAGLQLSALPDLLAAADLMVCLAVVNEATESLMNADAFARMRRR